MELYSNQNFQALPKEYLSVKGVGTWAPDPKSTVITSDGIKVPIGKLKQNDIRSLIYNEYIVYNEAQIKMKYLVHVYFNTFL